VNTVSRYSGGSHNHSCQFALMRSLNGRNRNDFFAQAQDGGRAIHLFGFPFRGAVAHCRAVAANLSSARTA
jgi:hypothetical protein